MKKFRIKSFCKINLTLKVFKRFKTNYHNIESLITFCNLYDVITVRKIKGLSDKIKFSGKFKNKINEKSNTITEVLHLLRERNFFKDQAFKIDIQKNIPHGSGLGGGSSNAASLLNFFNSKMDLKINKTLLNKIARQIGFDVPINLEKKNTLLTNKEGKILRLNNKFRLNILIVYPNIICSTRKIFTRNKKFTFSKSQSNYYTQNKKKLINFLKKERNDLEEIVVKFYPKVGKIIDFIRLQNNCYFSRITGSGSACIGIFSNQKSAVSAKKLIRSKFPNHWCFVSKTI